MPHSVAGRGQHHVHIHVCPLAVGSRRLVCTMAWARGFVFGLLLFVNALPISKLFAWGKGDREPSSGFSHDGVRVISYSMKALGLIPSHKSGP